jgi:hypothetical protein
VGAGEPCHWTSALPAATLSTDTVTEKFSWLAHVSLVSLEYALSVNVPCTVVVLLPPHAARASTGTSSAMYLMSTPPCDATGTKEPYGLEATLAFRLGVVMVTLVIAVTGSIPPDLKSGRSPCN